MVEKQACVLGNLAILKLSVQWCGFPKGHKRDIDSILLNLPPTRVWCHRVHSMQGVQYHRAMMLYSAFLLLLDSAETDTPEISTLSSQEINFPRNLFFIYCMMVCEDIPEAGT